MLTIVSFLEVLIRELTVNTFAQLRQSRTYLGAVNTLSTSPIMSLEITSLDHEPSNNPMEGSSLVSKSFGQIFISSRFLLISIRTRRGKKVRNRLTLPVARPLKFAAVCFISGGTAK